MDTCLLNTVTLEPNSELEYLGQRYPATVTAEPLYDPKMEKLLG